MGDERTPTIRTFLAVAVAPAIHAKLVELKHELSRCDAAVRWVRDDALHATVKFLGSVRESALPEIQAALTGAAGAAPRMTAALRGLGVFPALQRPRVIWVGLDCQPLSSLAAAVDAALAPLGFAPEPRAFHAHITLGRVNTMRNWTALEAALRAHWTDDIGCCALDELIGYRSDLRRDGAVYTKLWTIPFGG